MRVFTPSHGRGNFTDRRQGAAGILASAIVNAAQVAKQAGTRDDEVSYGALMQNLGGYQDFVLDEAGPAIMGCMRQGDMLSSSCLLNRLPAVPREVYVGVGSQSGVTDFQPWGAVQVGDDMPEAASFSGIRAGREDAACARIEARRETKPRAPVKEVRAPMAAYAAQPRKDRKKNMRVKALFSRA